MRQYKSLFGSIVRYLPSPKRDPREDSLTQSLLALLLAEQRFGAGPRDDGLLACLLDAWGATGELEPPVIRSQRRVALPDRSIRIDLAIEWGADRVIWVEVKHGADLSGEDQLEKYCEELDRRGADPHSKVVFLPPLGYGDAMTEHESVANRLLNSNWQVTGTAISRWLERQSRIDSRFEWLVSEFLVFLAEEGLLMTGALDEEILEQLAAAKKATQIVGSLLSDVDTRMEKLSRRPEIADDYKPGRAKWPSFWSIVGFEPGSNKFGNTWLEWCLIESLDGIEGPVFCAGMTLGKEVDPESIVVDRNVDGLGIEEIEFGGYNRLFRVMSVAEYVRDAPDDKEGQVNYLASWVEKAWEAFL